MIKGRRRIGKSRLAEEFSRPYKTMSFLGLPPEDGLSAQDQRDHFARQLNLPGIAANDWDDLFFHLANQTRSGRIIIILDEINWMGSKDRTFLPKLKTAWDAHFSKNPNLIMILSGSMSAWIDKNILNSTGFFGRINLELTLEELPLSQCSHFWHSYQDKVSSYEKFKVLSVTGGIPRYLELLQPEQNAEANIQRLCFQRDGQLVHEFERVFSDLFSRRNVTYKRIIKQLVTGPKSPRELFKTLGYTHSGAITSYLDDLVKTQYLAKDPAWDLKKGKSSRTQRYRLRDNYLRFYLKYIEPHLEIIQENGQMTPPAWETIMGLQFENLVLNNLPAILKRLNINPSDVMRTGPFIQTATARRKGCQIGLLIQTRYQNLFLCEIKFSRDEIRSAVIDQVEEKMKRLSLPRGFSIRPILIHVNGVREEIEFADYFAELIDFSELFQA